MAALFQNIRKADANVLCAAFSTSEKLGNQQFINIEQ